MTNVSEAAKRSVQTRADDDGFMLSGGLYVPSNYFRAQSDTDVAPYGYRGRDKMLREVWRQSGATVVASAIAVMVQKVQATRFIIEGPERTTSKAQKLVDESDLGNGWDSEVAKEVTDFLTTDNGIVREILGGGDPTGPLDGPILGIAHMDSARCERTGDLDYPIIYYDVNGGIHKMHRTRVVFRADLPSPDEKLLGRGFCALSRCIAEVQYAINWARARNEMLDDMPPLSFMAVNNIKKESFQKQVDEYERDREAERQKVMRAVMMFFSNDSGKPVSIDITPVRQLWESFKESESFSVIVDIVAMAFGLDRQELAPLATSAMGSGQQSGVLDRKSKGKGIGAVYSTLEHMWRPIMPKSCKFYFDYQDDDEDRRKAEIRQLKANIVVSLYSSSASASSVTTGVDAQSPLAGLLGAGTGAAPEPLITRDEARELLVREGVVPDDIINPQIGDEPTVQLDDLAPEQTDMQRKMYGLRVKRLSDGKIIQLEIVPKMPSLHTKSTNRVPIDPITPDEIAAARKRLLDLGISLEVERANS